MDDLNQTTSANNPATDASAAATTAQETATSTQETASAVAPAIGNEHSGATTGETADVTDVADAVSTGAQPEHVGIIAEMEAVIEELDEDAKQVFSALVARLKAAL